MLEELEGSMMISFLWHHFYRFISSSDLNVASLHEYVCKHQLQWLDDNTRYRLTVSLSVRDYFHPRSNMTLYIWWNETRYGWRIKMLANYWKEQHANQWSLIKFWASSVPIFASGRSIITYMQNQYYTNENTSQPRRADFFGPRATVADTNV